MTEYDKGFVDGLVAVTTSINESLKKGCDSDTIISAIINNIEIINDIRREYTHESND